MVNRRRRTNHRAQLHHVLLSKILKSHLGSKAQTRLLAKTKKMSSSTIPFILNGKNLKVQNITHILDRDTEIRHFGSETGSGQRHRLILEFRRILWFGQFAKI